MPCLRNVGLPNRSHKSIYASGKKRSTVRVKCLARQEHDTKSPEQCSEPGTLDPVQHAK